MVDFGEKYGEFLKNVDLGKKWILGKMVDLEKIVWIWGKWSICEKWGGFGKNKVDLGKMWWI